MEMTLSASLSMGWLGARLMSTIVAVLRAYCRNQAASVTQLQTESYRRAARWSLKTGLEPRLSCFSPCSLLVGS